MLEKIDEQKPGGFFWGGEQPLYYSAFLMDITMLMLVTSVPFVVVALGGSRTQAGDFLGYQQILYFLGCLSSALLLDKLNSKRAAQFGSGGVALAIIGMLAVVLLGRAGRLESPVSKLAWAIAAVGLPLSYFWPSLMGWLSQGHEGPSLNKRMGWFNLSWSLGAILGPLLAGGLLLAGMNLMMAVLTLLGVMTAAMMSMVRQEHKQIAPTKIGDIQIADERKPQAQAGHHPWLPGCRWLARPALFGSLFCVFSVRTQLGLLMKEDLGYTENDFGILMMLLSVLTGASMFGLSRIHLWHYRPGVFFAVQILLAAAMLLFSVSQAFWLLGAGVMLLGLAAGFCYSSHLFYGASGGKRRMARMAVHELIYGSGSAGGAFAAGRLSDALGVRAPYLAALGATLLVLGVQVLLWRRLRPKEEVVVQSEMCGERAG